MFLLPFLHKFIVVYFDDILVHSKTREEHLSHLDSLFTVVNSNKLVINLKKCLFLVTKISFLGFIIGQDGLKMNPSKIKAISDWPQPQSIKGIQCFLGIASFYRKFIKTLVL